MAITWYFALAHMLARSGVDLDELFDAVSAWLNTERRAWLRPVVDPATGLRSVVLWVRTDDGAPLAVFGRITERDMYVFNARYLTPDETGDFEKWEATQHD